MSISVTCTCTLTALTSENSMNEEPENGSKSIKLSAILMGN